MSTNNSGGLFQMDCGAVDQASDEILHDLGITKKGDILSLRGYCRQKLQQAIDAARKGTQEETKRKLLTELFNQKKKKSKKTRGDPDPKLESKSETEKKKKEKVKHRRIQMGWLHYDEQRGRYVSVRLNKGGGSREVDVPLNADVPQMIDIAKDIFFPDGKTTFGPLADMELGLANFKCENIPEFNDVLESFTLQQYINAFKATRIRLYVQTKRASIHSSANIYDNQDDSFLLRSAFSVQQSEESSVSLIGSPSDREDLRKKQEEEYMQSLALDKAKEESKKQKLSEEREKAERQLGLHQMRLARVEAEPLQTEPKIEVSVRHIHHGVVSRSFHPHKIMSHVYDWVGSLSILPEYFHLCGFDGKCLLPSESVTVADKQMLYMTESETMPNLDEEDPEINVRGFGNCEHNYDDTLPPESSPSQPSSCHEVSPVPDLPPEQLMEDDDLV